MIKETNKIFNADILSRSRKQHHVFSRIAYSKIMRNYGKTLENIADEIGRNHASIIYYCKQHEQLYKFDQDYKLKFDQLYES